MGIYTYIYNEIADLLFVLLTFVLLYSDAKMMDTVQNLDR